MNDLIKLTRDEFEELKKIEDCIDALENGYYDTHNLDEIAQDEEEFREKLKMNKSFLPYGVSYFGRCIWIDGILISDEI